MKSNIEGLAKRLDQVEVSKTWNPSRDEIIADFINQLPAELRNQIIAYAREQVKLKAEGKTD